MDDHSEEGWFTDPFGRHEARWLSDGTPTRLVRDGGVESYDDPPAEPVSSVPVRIDGTAPRSGADLQRSDDAESGVGYDSRAAGQAAFDVLDQSF